MPPSRLERRLQEQRRGRSKTTKVITLLLILVAIVASATFYYFTNGISINKAKRAGIFAGGHNKVNILVLGVDEREGDKGRSDTMFVVTVDQDTKDVAMLSIPRDTRVKIPRYGWDKINHAWAEGGQELAQSSVENLLGIPIDYYVKVDFAGFYKIVDAVGGVDIDVEKRMYYEDPYDNLVINIKPGLQHMDGRTAIKYVRYRDSEGDIGRIERQQKFIKAMLERVTSPAIITRVPTIIREVSASIKTDMSTGDMLNFAKMLSDAKKKGLKTETVPGRPAFIADVSYWLPDILTLREDIAQLQGIPMDDKYLSTSRQLAREYEASIPKEMKVLEPPKSAKKDDSKDKTKDVKAPTAPNSPNAPKDADKPAEPGQPGKPEVQPAKLRVEIINSSGDAEAGAKMAALMRNQGFEVAGVTTTTNANKNTIVVAHSSNEAVVGKLTGLPFKYALQVTKNDSRAGIVQVVVGKDFVDK